MKAKFFNSIENLDWTRLWWIEGVVLVFWGGLAGLTVIWPAFDTPYKVINFFLTAAGAALLFAARGTKYVKDRTEPPQDGKV